MTVRQLIEALSKLPESVKDAEVWANDCGDSTHVHGVSADQSQVELDAPRECDCEFSEDGLTVLKTEEQVHREYAERHAKFHIKFKDQKFQDEEGS